MLSRIIISTATAAALFTAPVGLVARSCILSSVPSQKACQPSCCANKTCCATSPKNTASPSQPLAKADSGQQLSATCFGAALSLSSCEIGAEQFRCQAASPSTHSPPPRLALLCTFLIWSRDADARGVPIHRHAWSSTVLLDQWKQLTLYYLI